MKPGPTPAIAEKLTPRKSRKNIAVVRGPDRTLVEATTPCALTLRGVTEAEPAARGTRSEKVPGAPLRTKLAKFPQVLVGGGHANGVEADPPGGVYVSDPLVMAPNRLGPPKVPPVTV